LVLAGDDRAISIMMAYFEKHQSSPLWRSDYDVSEPGALVLIAYGIAGGANPPAIVGTPISERRFVSGAVTLAVALGTEDSGFKERWIHWWETHKDAPVATAT
jgi:hypothetical protein